MEYTLQERGERQDRVKEKWKKLVESEARVKYWGELVRMGAGTKELELIGESLHQKFRSIEMQNKKDERWLVESGTTLKWKDERKYMVQVRKELEKEKEVLKERIGNGWKFRKRIKEIKRNAKIYKKEEEKRLGRKIENIIRMRIEEDEKKLDICPEEMIEYKEARVFNKTKFKHIALSIIN